MRTLGELKLALKPIVGESCWSAGCGPSTGSVINLHIGDPVPRPTVLTNPYLTEKERRYQGAFGFMIYCVWRIESPSEIVGGCWEDNQPNGPMETHLNRIIDSPIIDIEGPTIPGLDLAIRFTNNITLRLFCDQTNEGDDNYWFFTPNGIYVVGSRSRLGFEGAAKSDQ